MLQEFKKIKVVIVEDYKLTRLSLRRILETYDKIKVLADTGDAETAIEIANTLNRMSS